MSNPKDDLDAVRDIAAALSGFGPDDQERILRWVRERVGLRPAVETSPASENAPQLGTPLAGVADGASTAGAANIRQFVEQKKPQSDAQYAATVAYFHRFLAPSGERCDEITPNQLVEATRLAPWPRFKNAAVTLNNTLKLGYLDRGKKRGTFKLNSVGENLVAMSLPAGETEVNPRLRKKPRKKPSPKLKRRR